MPHAAIRISHETQIRACREVPKLAQVRGYWEVRVFTACNGWVNCWSVVDNGEDKPLTYATRDEAAKDVREIITDQRIECELGQRHEDECDSLEDFQIVFVETGKVN